MNKYQIKFLNDIILGATNAAGDASVTVDADGNIVITQNENYNVTSYALKLRKQDISAVSYYVNAWKNAPVDDLEIQIPVDFNNPTTIIRISLKDGLVDDFEANIKLISSDKTAWNEKHSAKLLEERRSRVRVQLKSNGSLHSLIFNSSCSECAYSVVKWYAITSARSDAPGVYRKRDGSTVIKTFLEEVKVEKKFYCNIEIAYEVGFSLTQYDAKGNELISVSEGI